VKDRVNRHSVRRRRSAWSRRLQLKKAVARALSAGVPIRVDTSLPALSRVLRA
jgi:hypothetical protein